MIKKIAHIIGRTISRFKVQVVPQVRPSFDYTLPDFEWWDQFRNALLTGYQYSAMLADTITEILAAHIVGKGVNATVSPVEDKRFLKKAEHTNRVLQKFMALLRVDLIQLIRDLWILGEQYVVVNADGSLTFLSPHLVTPLTEDATDLLRITGYEIVVKDDFTTIKTVYTEQTKIVTTSIFNKTSGVTVTTTKTFPNLIGTLPVVPFYAKRDRNSLRGKSLFFNVRFAFAQLDDLLTKGVQGGKITGNPIPVFENLRDPGTTIDLNATEEDDTYIDKDGNEETRKTIKWDNETALFLGEGGKFKFAAPPIGFSRDVLDLVNSIFTLILHKIHSPRHVWAGNELNTEAGADAQTPAWVMFIDSLRHVVAGQSFNDELKFIPTFGLYRLIYVWLKTKALIDPKILVSSVSLDWTKLTERDSRLTFEIIKWAFSRTLLSKETALRTLDVAADPVHEIEQAEEESQTEVDEFDDFGGTELDDDLTPDDRKKGGADAPRAPASGGGGRN